VIGEGPALRIEAPVDGRPRTAHEVARDALRRAILEGALPGGTRLRQADIAARLGISTTPLREALRELASEGLVRLDAHRGATVVELDQSEIEEIYDLRKLLEPAALRRAAERITPDEITRARALCDRMRIETDPTVWAELNTAFHDVIIQASHSPRLVDIIEKLRAGSAPYVALALRTGGAHIPRQNVHHEQILQGLANGDGEATSRTFLKHLEETLDELVRVTSPKES
jgi:DNA-binding GntR family transcriptional regulator